MAQSSGTVMVNSITTSHTITKCNTEANWLRPISLAALQIHTL